MSVPAWKQALINKRREQEEAERRKQQEKEQYYASLPPWKRAMLQRKEGALGQTSNMKTKSSDSSSSGISVVQPKTIGWKQPQTVAQNISNKKDEHILRADKLKTEGERRNSFPEKIGITKELTGKFEQMSPKPPSRGRVQQTSPKFPLKDVSVKYDKIESSKTIDQREDEKNKEEEPEEKNSTPQAGTQMQSKQSVLDKLRGQFEQSSPNTRPKLSSPSTRPKMSKAKSLPSFEINDSKSSTMPKWKQDLLKRKQQHNKDSSKTSPSSSPSQSQKFEIKNQSAESQSTLHSPTAKTPPTSFAPDQKMPTTSSSPPSSPKLLKEKPVGTVQPKETPEVVNASNKKDEDSPKLLHKEGKSIRPPAIKPAKKWADVKEDDPEFLNLPEWKRILILRRRSDYVKRTAPPVEETKEEKKEEEKNEPLSSPLWSPTHQETKEVIRPPPVEKVEEKNPALEWRKNLRKVSKTEPTREGKPAAETGGRKESHEGPVENGIEEKEAEETLSPLKVNAISKKPKRGLRRVSWSDTDLNKSLTEEFVYPKYSYHDYDSIDQEVVEGESPDGNGLATPLHPWLSPTQTSPPQVTSTTKSMTGGFSPMGRLDSLGSFMSAYTSDTSSGYNGIGNSTEECDSQPVEEPKPDDSEDTAALIW